MMVLSAKRGRRIVMNACANCPRTRSAPPGRGGSCHAAALFFVTLASLALADEAVQDRPVSEPAARVREEAIENLFRLSPRIFSGAQPEGEAGFRALQKLGVRTVISVDGSAPEVDLARRHGLRYVHLPIGYDGISAARAVQLIKAARDLPGPVFVHCHHGKHRGPAAAALCALGVDGWSRAKALRWMRDAGTSADYRGLFRSVETLPLPDPAALEDKTVKLPETAPVSTLVEVMVQVDHSWDRLKASHDRDFRLPDDPDESNPAQQALQLRELLRELGRSDDARQRGQAFRQALREAEGAAGALEQALRDVEQGAARPQRDAVESAFRRVSRSCTTCHARFRDNGENPD